MRIATVEPVPVSVPYRHREISSQVARDGVSDVLVKVTTDDGLVGWGEACCGADTASVEAALRAMTPFVVGRDPWNRDAMRRDVFTHGLWQFRAGTGNFAWAGIDMALWDLCGRACGQPIWRLLGGLQQQEATYFYYLARDTREGLAGTGRRRPRRRLRRVLSQGRPRRRGGPRARLDRAGGARPGPPPAARRERELDAAAGAAEPPGVERARHRFRRAARARSPDRAARGGARADRRDGLRERRPVVRGRGLRPDPRRDRPTSTASRRTGSDRSEAFTGSPGSRITRGFRSASTRTASSGSRPRPASTSC